MQDTSYDLYLVVRNGVTTMPATITTLSNKAKQPKGGYLPVKLFKEAPLLQMGGNHSLIYYV